MLGSRKRGRPVAGIEAPGPRNRGRGREDDGDRQDEGRDDGDRGRSRSAGTAIAKARQEAADALVALQGAARGAWRLKGNGWPPRAGPARFLAMRHGTDAETVIRWLVALVAGESGEGIMRR